MLGWAIIINNLGRRRYPLHWWASGRTFVVNPAIEHDEAMRATEEAEERREEEEEEGEMALENEETESKRGSRRGSRGSHPTSPGPVSLQDAFHAHSLPPSIRR